VRDGIAVARSGIPAVALVTTDYWPQGDFVANSLGMPGVPRVKLPHPVAGSGVANMRSIARQVLPAIVQALAGETPNAALQDS
jgi:hypothetical protein